MINFEYNIFNRTFNVFVLFLPLGVSQINQTTIWNVSDSVDTKSKALDNNLDTFYSSEERTNASWILILDATYLMKWFLISIRGGISN